MTEQPTTPDTCCVCDGGPVVYRNYQEQPFCTHCANCACGTVPCTRPAPDSLREQYAAAIRPNMLMGLQDAELDGPGGTQRINEWVDWIAKELAKVRDREMEQLRADLDRVQQAACRTSENLRHAEDRVAELEKDAAITAEVMEKADADLDGIIETARYFKALAERTQAWGEQHRDRANRYRARTDAVNSECHALNSETKGLNPFAMAGRRDAVARIRAALQTISYDTPVPDDPRVAELEQQLADADGELTEARDHNDRTCEAVARAAPAEAAVERVRELHQRWDADPGSCAHCHDSYGTPLPYPCPTARALDQAQQPAGE